MEFQAFSPSRLGVIAPEDIPPRVKQINEIVENVKDRIPYIVLRMDPAVGRQVFDVGALAVWTEEQTPQEWMELMEKTHAQLTDTEAVLNP